MRVLLSNDDGVHAPGLRALIEGLSSKYETTVIAPLEERSTTGHSLSLDKPLRLEQLGNNIYGCSGFPGDCVLMGIGHVMKEKRPQVVVSGINRGANLGQDLYYSGTIAAAREGAFHGVPAMAVSLVFKDLTDDHRYDTAARVIDWCLEQKLFESCPAMSLLNINVPNRPLEDLQGFKFTQIGFRRYSEEIHARIDSRNRNYYWIAGIYQGFDKDPSSDCQAVEDGFVSITPHGLVDSCSREYGALKKAIESLNEKYFS